MIRRGKITEDHSEPQTHLTGQLMQVAMQFDGNIKPVNFHCGKLRRLMTLSGFIKKVYEGIRHLRKKRPIRVKHDANLFAATTAELIGLKNAKNKLSAPIIAAETVNANVDSRTRASITARLRAYFKGNLKFVAKLFTSHKANLTTVESTAAKYQEEIKTKSSTDINVADSITCKSEKKIESQVKAVGTTVDANVTTAKKIVKPKVKATGSASLVSNTSVVNEINAKTQATASAIRTAAVNIDGMTKASHTAKLMGCYFYEQDGDSLLVYQVFSGVQSRDALEIDRETENEYFANAFVANGVMNLLFVNTASLTDNELELI